MFQTMTSLGRDRYFFHTLNILEQLAFKRNKVIFVLGHSD
jgi:hypothetical protein